MQPIHISHVCLLFCICATLCNNPSETDRAHTKLSQSVQGLHPCQIYYLAVALFEIFIDISFTCTFANNWSCFAHPGLDWYNHANYSTNTNIPCYQYAVQYPYQLDANIDMFYLGVIQLIHLKICSTYKARYINCKTHLASKLSNYWE